MTEIIVAVLASSGLWGVIQYFISRRDKTAEGEDMSSEPIEDDMR